MNRSPISFLLPLTLCLAAACSDDVQGAESGRTNLSTTWAEVQTYAVEQREIAQQQLRDALDRLGEDINELERRAGDASETARQKLQIAIADLREQRDQLGMQLDKLKQDGAEAWSDARDKLVQGMRSVDESLDEAWNDATN